MAITGQGSRSGLPRLVRRLLWLMAALAAGVLTYRAYPHIAEPFQQAAAVEMANTHIERVRYEKMRERNHLQRQLELANTDEGKADILRRSRYQKRGWSHLMGDGVGAPPSKRSANQ